MKIPVIDYDACVGCETCEVLCPDVFEITEHVISKKKLGYFNTPHVQQTIVKTLNQHLRQNYSIKNIELVKVDEVSCPGIKNIVEENISIYIKEKENQ